MTRPEGWLRRLTIAFVCATVIVACIWLLGVLFDAIGRTS